MLFVADLHVKMLGNGVEHDGEVGLLQGAGHGLTDTADGQIGMDGQHAVAAALVDGYGFDVGVGGLGGVADALVTGDAEQGHLVIGGQEGVDGHFGDALAVDEDVAVAQVHGVGQGAGVPAGSAVIAGEHAAVKAAVQAHHHGAGQTGPAAMETGALRQAPGIDVAGGIVGVLDHDILTARVHGALTGGGHLPGHLVGKVLPVGMVLFGLVPMGDARGAFDVGGNEDLHGGSFQGAL